MVYLHRREAARRSVANSGAKMVRVFWWTLIWSSLFITISWLNANTNVPAPHEKFRKWLAEQKRWLSENYERQHNYPDLYDLANRDGVLFMQRNFVDNDWIEYTETDQGLKYSIKIPEGKDDLLHAHAISSSKFFELLSQILR